MYSISLPQMMVEAEFIYPLPSEKQKNHQLPKLRLGGVSDGLGKDGPEWLRPENTKEAQASQAALLPSLVASGAQSGRALLQCGRLM